MFPKRSLSRTYVSQVIQEQDLMDINLLTTKQQFLNDSLNNEGGDESSVVSSLSDISSASKRSKWIGAKHGRKTCLYCCRLRKPQRLQNQTHLDSGAGDFSLTSNLCETYTNSTTTLPKKGARGSTNKNQQQQQSSAGSIQLSDIQFHSPESILSEESIPDKLTANILYNVQRLANPVSAKQSKLALLELKNKHTNSFKDICLYSEVCRTLGRNCYRIKSRRFLQELFQDVDFDTFYNEPLEIISKKEKDSFKNIEIKEKAYGVDSLLLLKERMKRDNPCNRPDSNNSINKIESIQAVVPSNNVIIGPQTLKTNIKSQILASVCEASCENLNLDSSPPISNTSISEKSLIPKHNLESYQLNLGKFVPMERNSPCNHLDSNVSNSKTESVQAPLPSNNVIIGPQTLKIHSKSQILASVCEASCENLNLDSSPPIANTSISEKSTTSKQICKSFTVAPPPAAPPPLHKYNTELRITSDDDDDNDDDVHNNNINEDHSGNICYRHSPQQQKCPNSDEIDGIPVSSSFSTHSLQPVTTSNTSQFIHLSTASSSHHTYLHSSGDGSFSTPISSSNCSDQTTESNRSSLCTISHYPRNINNNTRLNSIPPILPILPKPIENENTKFRRGRFYTLELDLSCTKNKFPITDRTKTNTNSLILASKPTMTDKVLTSSASFSLVSPTKPVTKNSTLLRQHSLCSETSSKYKLPISRMSYNTEIIPMSTSPTTATSTNLTHTTASSTDGGIQKYCITKSLASSLAQPFGTLYCEKRLQSSKSEAVLAQNFLVTTVNPNSSTKTNKCKSKHTSTPKDSTDIASTTFTSLVTPPVSVVENEHAKQS